MGLSHVVFCLVVAAPIAACTKRVVFDPNVAPAGAQHAPAETRFRICDLPDDGVELHQHLRVAVCGAPSRSAAEAASEYERAIATISRLALPPGTVIAYAGSDLPTGWLACDGHAVSQSEYKRLFDVIGTTYGDGGGQPGMFSLPDYQGRFLRGVSEQSGTDPDVTRRQAPWPGGKGGNTVGSTQPDALQDHVHVAATSRYERGPDGKTFQVRVHAGPEESNETGGVRGSDVRVSGETRPTNVAVRWLIRY